MEYILRSFRQINALICSIANGTKKYLHTCRKKTREEKTKEVAQEKHLPKAKKRERTKKWIENKTKNITMPGKINVKKKVKQWEQKETK